MIQRRERTHVGASRRGRAFTLLEVVLASLISMLVMGGALSLYFFVDGTDRRLQRRYQDVDNLQRIHLVMERVCTTLVMSDRAQAARGIGAGAPTDAASAAIAAAGGAKSGGASDPKAGGSSGSPSGTPGGSGRAGSTESGSTSSSGAKSGSEKGGSTTDSRSGVGLPRMPPRLLLTADTSFAAEVSALSTMTTGVAEGPSAQRLMTQPQRLEVAVSASPVPSMVSPAALEAARRAASRSTSSDRAEANRNFGPRDTADLMNVEDEEETSSRVIRGALELRPQRTRSRTARAEAPEQVLWELWWVPLAPRREVEPDAPAPAPIGEAYLVASDIAYLQYRMFDDRSRKTSFVAAFMQDIPAYVEVEVETARGLKANWLFEVSWSIGNELPPEQAAGASADGASKDGSKSGSDPKAGGTPSAGGDKGGGGKGGGK